MYFDFFEIHYQRLFEAIDNQLTFPYPAPGSWQYTVTQLFDPQVEVLDITDPWNPVRILNADLMANTLAFEVSHTGPARFIAAGDSRILAPKKLAFYQPPDFADMPEAEYVVITPSEFVPELLPLTTYREGQGSTTAIIDVQDLYREFNDGIYHPIAIKNFLAFTFENWEKPPVYVLLVGDGHWNFKNEGSTGAVYSNPPPIYMPPNLAYVDPWQGEVDSANLLATVVGLDTLPDVFISRIPVNSLDELRVVVSKTVDYELDGNHDWQNNMLFIADDIPDLAGNFVALADSTISDFIDPEPRLNPLRLYQNDFGCPGGIPGCDALTNAITTTINTDGALVVTYIGHASLNRWSGHSILVNSDIDTLDNSNQLPFILSMTCLDGYWTYPNVNSLAFDFLTTEGKGAVATFSATGLGVATGHDQLQRGIFSSLVNTGDWRLGAATFKGKLQLFLNGADQDLMHTFMLFGDPAVGLKNPYDVELNPDTAAGEDIAGSMVFYPFTVTNRGEITDTFSMAAQDNAWPVSFDPAIIGPLPPGGSADVMVRVHIPVNAVSGADTATIQAFSVNAINKLDQAAVTTTSIGPPDVHLPIVIRSNE
jgi:hypothetical protein